MKDIYPFVAILLTLLLTGVANAQTLAKASDGSGTHVYFRTGWTAPYIHYNAGSGWTTSPGQAMTKSTDATNFPAALGWSRYDLPASTALNRGVLGLGTSCTSSVTGATCNNIGLGWFPVALDCLSLKCHVMSDSA